MSTKIPALSFSAKSYYLLTKPGIIFGNLITALAGVSLAIHSTVPYFTLIAMVIGLGLTIASACVFNNYIDRESDAKMQRTKNRPLVLGSLAIRKALIFAVLLGMAGVSMLFVYVNTLSACLAIAGFFVYVVLYSLSKYHSVYCTLIGSIAGAIPPIVGYCSVSNRFDLPACVFFLMICLWQMPHFYAIAIFRLNDYKNANIPVFPNKKGIERTKVHMLLFLIGYCILSLTLGIFAGKIYIATSIVVNAYWVIVAIQGFQKVNDFKWARKMFTTSLIVIMSSSFALLINIVRSVIIGIGVN